MFFLIILEKMKLNEHELTDSTFEISFPGPI